MFYESYTFGDCIELVSCTPSLRKVVEDAIHCFCDGQHPLPVLLTVQVVCGPDLDRRDRRYHCAYLTLLGDGEVMVDGDGVLAVALEAAARGARGVRRVIR